MGEFKHITVTAAEEEDVVVRAGVAAGGADAGAAASGVGQAVRDVVPGGSDVPSREAVPGREDASSQGAAPTSHPGDARAEGSREYAGPSLDDLSSEPMPLAQKIVIIAAVVCIIGALIFYFAFMR